MISLEDHREITKTLLPLEGFILLICSSTLFITGGFTFIRLFVWLHVFLGLFLISTLLLAIVFLGVNSFDRLYEEFFKKKDGGSK